MILLLTMQIILYSYCNIIFFPKLTLHFSPVYQCLYFQLLNKNDPIKIINILQSKYFYTWCFHQVFIIWLLRILIWYRHQFSSQVYSNHINTSIMKLNNRRTTVEAEYSKFIRYRKFFLEQLTNLLKLKYNNLQLINH